MIKTFRFDNDINEFSANTYVVGEKNEPCVVIDMGSTTDRVIEYIKVNHCNSCLGVLLTHGHYDHIRGLVKFLNEYHCTLFIHQDEAEYLENTRLNCSYGKESDAGEIKIDYPNKYLLDDEDEIDFHKKGLFFKVIETKGHTRGSVCYLDKDENALFSGDTLFKGSIGRCDLPGGSEREMQASLEKLKVLDPKLVVYPGHGDTTTIKKELETNMFLK